MAVTIIDNTFYKQPESVDLTGYATEQYVSSAITTSQNNIQTIKDQNTSANLKIWQGTLAEYNNIVTKDSNTIYFAK